MSVSKLKVRIKMLPRKNGHVLKVKKKGIIKQRKGNRGSDIWKFKVQYIFLFKNMKQNCRKSELKVQFPFKIFDIYL